MTNRPDASPVTLSRTSRFPQISILPFSEYELRPIAVLEPESRVEMRMTDKRGRASVNQLETPMTTHVAEITDGLPVGEEKTASALNMQYDFIWALLISELLYLVLFILF
jgi:hypothetical protein